MSDKVKSRGGGHRSIAFHVREVVASLSHWPRTFRLIWEAAPRWTLAWAILLIVQGLLPAAAVYLTKLLIDSLVAAMGAGGAWERVRPALVLVALTASVMLLAEVLQSIIDWVRAAQAEFINDHITTLMHQKSIAVDLAFYESPNYYDRLDQARSEASSRSVAMLESGGSLVQNGLTLLAMAAVLIPYGPWLPLILLVSTLPAFYVVLRFDRHYHRWWLQTTTDRRRARYYDALLTNGLTAPELRLFELGKHFQSAYQALRRRMRTERLTQMRKQSLAKLCASGAALMVSGVTIAWMFWRALHGLATLGDLALFYQAFNQGQGLMRSLLGSLSKILTNSLYLGNLFKFLELKPRVVDPSRPIAAPPILKSGINFSRVTFRYPGSERVALQDFNLFIPAGKIVAVVGANGAGKTTLLKLLCRFYDPEAGRIELDGIDIRDISIKELRRLITVLFQFPEQYQMTVNQNIALGDLRAEPGAVAIEAAARCAGAHEMITRLPRLYDTLLGKWFGKGAELSGGEWQRIAMARAYLRQSPIILLDEPTSSMDSWAEADWFDRLRILAQDRTAIVITHRFSIAVRADIIHVMQDGEILESGSHHELLAQDGLYAQSWKAQMQACSKPVGEIRIDVSPDFDDLTLQEEPLAPA
jgi:ATP-binding cassette subfamily B protein